MKLPSMKYADKIRKTTQVRFGGLSHYIGAEDGGIWDMQNMTSDHAPVLATREKRYLYRKLEAPGGIYAWDKLCWVDGGKFYYDGVEKGEVRPGVKSFAAMGAYIIILPDKRYYNIDTDAFGELEAQWSGESLTFGNGLLYEEAAEANTISCEGVDWAQFFKAGDAVTISGCSKYPGNNKTIIIRQVSGDKLYFYEFSFTLDGEAGDQAYQETGTLTIRRKVPDLIYCCENENRLWGCSDTAIYASKQGDIFNWEVYDGLESDAYAVEPGSTGYFTGCISYRGYPVFFKEEQIYKVYGCQPSNFEVVGSATLGLAEGSGGSLAIAGETLFYLSRSGIMAYTGGIPQSIGKAFGPEHFRDAVAGADGLKYYVSMRGDDGCRRLYVYDTQRGTWHVEDQIHATHFAYCGGALYCLNDRGEIWILGNPQEKPEGAAREPDVEWMVEWCDFTEDSPNKKGLGKIQIRLSLDAGAELKAWMQFDSDGQWRLVKVLEGEDPKRSYYLPLVPRRCDHYRLKLTGTGGCKIYSLVREVYAGSEMKSYPGRN